MALNCYTPQHVALGPNQYWCPKLHDMEGYKIAATSVQQQLRFQNLNFKDLVKKLMEEFEADIRACYQKFIYLTDDELAIFYAIEENKKSKISLSATAGEILSVEEDEVLMKALALSLMSRMQDYSGSIVSRHAIVKDVMMLENQIPLFLLREMLKVQFFTSEESVNSVLSAMFKAFCKEICLFKFMVDNSPKIKVSKCRVLIE
ncbi:hypothetical protein Pint_30249 [Pistacia integerrima]|uniref:Uncharacterized protein n=1 Tax=Pistacia integerrima TaxID=434235 RepID=A0ACC0WY39_9ROSI|nr:hypothetical protein Pint_30249 [Pistacia integerrima]